MREHPFSVVGYYSPRRKYFIIERVTNICRTMELREKPAQRAVHRISVKVDGGRRNISMCRQRTCAYIGYIIPRST